MLKTPCICLKPISIGYKVFALAYHGYFSHFVSSSRKHGLAELLQHLNLTPTASMVLGLGRHLSKRIYQLFIVYLDNSFIRIFSRNVGESRIWAHGTTMATSSKDLLSLLKELMEAHAK